MASVKISNKPAGLVSKISDVDYLSSKITNVDFNVKIKDGSPNTKSIKEISPNIKIKDSNPHVRINQILPFRVRFTNIQIPSYMGGIPPIGIAIIGVNNYIL